MWRVISSGRTWAGRLTNRRKDGSLYEEEMTITPVTDMNGAIINYVAVKIDITREMRLNKAKDYFVSVTSHELRTPLTKLQLAKGLLADADKTPKVEKAVAVLSQAYQDIEKIVSATTILLSLKAGNLSSRFRSVAVTPLVQTTVSNTIAIAQDRGRKIDFVVDIEPLAEVKLHECEPAMVQRALTETLSNAVKYTNDGGRISVIGRVEEGIAVIKIKDSGIGIAPADIASLTMALFSVANPSHHTSGSYSYMGGGVGLGLTLAKMVAEVYGGDFRIESQGEGMGSEVTFHLPISSTETV
jgi:signal transduction histidine kinase